MKRSILFFLGSLLMTSMAFSAEDVNSEKPGTTPGDKMMEQIKKDPSKNPEKSEDFNSEKLGHFTQKPIFSSESSDQKEREKIVEGHRNDFNKSSLNHVQRLYECNKLVEAKAAKECRKNEIKLNKKKN